MTVLKSHPEWSEALLALRSELDIPDRIYRRLGPLMGPGLGRLFFRDWIRQDAADPEFMPDPFDDTGDPVWFRIDGWPEQGGSMDDILRRKWGYRARLWMIWHSPEVWRVIDWLIFSVETGQTWLDNLDDAGEPKKLVKCGSLDRMVHEAYKGLQRRDDNPDIVLDPDDEQMITDLGSGHAMIELVSGKAIRREGVRMRNCLCTGDYHLLPEHIERRYRLFSIRDPAGKPRATIEVMGSRVRQFRGPYNGNPNPVVVELVSAAAAELGWGGLIEAALGLAQEVPLGGPDIQGEEQEPAARQPR